MGIAGEAGRLWGASTVVCLDKRCFLGPWAPAGTFQEAARSRLLAQQDCELEQQDASGIIGEGLKSGSRCRQSQRQRSQALDFCLMAVCP